MRDQWMVTEAKGAQANADIPNPVSACCNVESVNSDVRVEQLPSYDDFHHGGRASGGELCQRQDRPADTAGPLAIIGKTGPLLPPDPWESNIA